MTLKAPKYERIKISQKELTRLFPKKVLSDLEEQSYYIYGATEQKHVIGACVFSLSEEYYDTAILHYVAVAKDYRYMGIGSELLQYGLNKMREAGVKYVFFRELVEDAMNYASSYRFARRNKFLLLCEVEYLLSYDVMDLLENSYIMNNMKSKKGKSELLPEIRSCGEGTYILDSGTDAASGDTSEYIRKIAVQLFEVVQDDSAEECIVQVIGDEKRHKLLETIGEPRAMQTVLEMVCYL